MRFSLRLLPEARARACLQDMIMTKTKPVTFVTLAVAAVTIPPTGDGGAAPGTHLIGAGLLIAMRDADRWRFTSEAAVIAAGEKEQNLLPWLADRLPAADTLIGWQIDQRLVPLLIDAAAHADAAIAQHFLAKLLQVLRGNVVDLGIDASRAANRSKSAKETCSAAPNMNPDALIGSWGVGQLDAIRADLATEALGSWLRFARQTDQIGAEAERATRAWLHRRRDMHLAKIAPRAT